MGRFKDFILKNKSFLREVAIILIVGIIVNALCFLMPLVVHAESPSNYYPVENGVNSEKIPLSAEQIIKYCNDNIATFLEINDMGYCIRCESLNNSSKPNACMYMLLVWDKTGYEYNPFYIEVSTNKFFEFHSNSNTPGPPLTYRVYTFYDWYGDLSDVNNKHYYTGYNLNLLNANSPLYDEDVCYYFNDTFNLGFNTNNDFPVLLYYDNPIDIGDFTDLPAIDEILDDLSNSYEPPSGLTGHALPSQPTENPNNNDFQNRLQMFDYLKDVLTALFGNLGYNISNWLNSLGSKIVQGFNSVSQNIWNGFATLMSNIQGFFAPKLDYIIDKFNYITAEPDQEQILDFIETTSVYSDISSINTSVSTFGSSFSGVSEPNDYTIILHIEDIDILNQSDPFVLHLNILNPVKSTIRAFLWVIVSYGLFISVIDSLPNYINGGGGEDD